MVPPNGVERPKALNHCLTSFLLAMLVNLFLELLTSKKENRILAMSPTFPSNGTLDAADLE